jgi:GNAT superfamily N-acetyltransferase
LDLFPIAVLADLDVVPAERHQGHGRNAVRRFIGEAIEGGAKCGFLKIGWFGNRTREGNILFYEKTGWVLLKDLPPLTVPFMYHKLS